MKRLLYLGLIFGLVLGLSCQTAPTSAQEKQIRQQKMILEQAQQLFEEKNTMTH